MIHGSPDIEDQGVAILRHLLSQPVISRPIVLSVVGEIDAVKKQLAAVLGSASSRVAVVQKASLRGIWTYWRSDHVFFTHGIYLASWKPARQVVVSLWHGMPLKALWKANTKQEFTAVQACDYMLCTSALYGDVIHQLNGLPRSALKDIGLPRNDLLFSATPAVQAFRRRVLDQGQAGFAVCLPTFRLTRGQHHKSDGQEGENALMMSPTELEDLQAVLASAKIKLLVKPHPMSVHYGQQGRLSANIQIISDQWIQKQGVTLYEVLGQSAFLITDISSVYVDYLCLGRPIFFFFPDLSAYRETRGFVFEPIEDWLAGRLCTSAAQLVNEVREYVAGVDSYRERRHALANKLNPQCEPGATRRLLTMLGLE